VPDAFDHPPGESPEQHRMILDDITRRAGIETRRNRARRDDWLPGVLEARERLEQEYPP
jgi:hypothetical protein